MPSIDLSILNQRQTPAFYADVFANRPAAGFVGRIFVSTDTFAFYRDNGTGWDLIGGPGTGTVTGTGANGQVTFWNGASTITGSNDLFWDATNGHLGVNTNAPGTALDVHHDQSTVAILNQTVATNDTRIAFQNSGVAKWRVGNFYNLGSNDYAVNDATLNINRFTVKSSSGQTFVGDETTSSGLFVVNNSSGDAHIVALGATAPSIRVRNAGVGATLQFGLGLATTTNNFIQGATGGEFCIFNDSLTAQPILFGIKDAGLGNTQEAARISAARNFLIGTTTDAGYKLAVNGTINAAGRINSGSGGGATASLNAQQLSGDDAAIYAGGVATAGSSKGIKVLAGTNSSDYALNIASYSNSPIIYARGDGNVGIGTTSPTRKLEIQNGYLRLFDTSALSGAGYALEWSSNNGGTNAPYANIDATTTSSGNQIGDLIFRTANSGSPTEKVRITSAGSVGIGTATPAYKLDVTGVVASNTGFLISSGQYSNITEVPYTGIYMTGSSSPDGFGSLLISSRTDAARPIIFGTSSGSASAERMRIAASTGNLLIGTTTDGGNKLAVEGQTFTKRLSYAYGIQSTKLYSDGPVTSTTINIPNEFPELSGLTISNTWGVTGIIQIFIGGQAQTVQFSISRTSGSGSWGTGVIGLSSVTSSTSLTSITGSGNTITLNFSSSIYCQIILTAIVA